jgi:hypothetical protein
MKILKYFIIIILALANGQPAKAQNKKSDSLELAATLKTLLSVSNTIDVNDPNREKLGPFYKAAPYIIYRGDDKKRAWIDFTNYTVPEEKNIVDNFCARMNISVNRDKNYKIVKYFTDKQSEGVWHVLMIQYTKSGINKSAGYAFLKIGRRFGLGDID